MDTWRSNHRSQFTNHKHTHQTPRPLKTPSKSPNCITMEEAIATGGCEKLHKALLDCHRRTSSSQSACRHLNRAFATCIIGVICPSESEAVRSLCSSGGTALKRSQCERARLELSVCLSSHQDDDQS
ncbi:uncharacterized protein LOC141622660 [Silene latifolia]|uniref:uncharacterized protein LOC141622660 n=1 Tax=Silene latifolia TaxID=37657 RepID=UPI003D77C923